MRDGLATAEDALVRAKEALARLRLAENPRHMQNSWEDVCTQWQRCKNRIGSYLNSNGGEERWKHILAEITADPAVEYVNLSRNAAEHGHVETQPAVAQSMSMAFGGGSGRIAIDTMSFDGRDASGCFEADLNLKITYENARIHLGDVVGRNRTSIPAPSQDAVELSALALDFAERTLAQLRKERP